MCLIYVFAFGNLLSALKTLKELHALMSGRSVQKCACSGRCGWL